VEAPLFGRTGWKTVRGGGNAESQKQSGKKIRTPKSQYTLNGLHEKERPDSSGRKRSETVNCKEIAAAMGEEE